MKKFILLSLCFLIIQCGGENVKIPQVQVVKSCLITDLNSFYLKQLDQHQVLLLGESKHNDQVFDQAVIDLINDWLDRVEKNEEVPSKITLILEYSQSFGKQLNDFFDKRDVPPLEMEIQGRTLNTYEFFYDLKTVSQRVVKMKERYPVEFNVFCPEKDYPFDLSREDQIKIAKTERDNNTARNILDYIKQNPDYKFIAFYGGGHIARQEHPEFNVTPWGVQIKEKGIRTVAVYLNHFYDPIPFPLPFPQIESNFALTRESFKKLYPRFKPSTDADVFYKEFYFQAMTLKDIPSVLVIQKALDYARQSPRFVPILVSYWHRFTGENISNSKDVLQYVEKNIGSVNTIQVIDDLSLFKNLFWEFEQRNMPRQEIDMQMFDITCFGNILSRKPYPLTPNQTAKDLWMGIIHQYQREIKMNLFTALLFCGTPTEKTQAEQKLIELTGKEFTTPQKWLQYTREVWNSI